jgi:uncharacterized protein (UPF0276 family)
VHGVNLNDLLPIPYTAEALDHVSGRIRRVQGFLGRRIAIENVSSYVTFAESEMDEWTFVRELCERADCWLLFDVNNVFVSSFNHDFDRLKFIDAVPLTGLSRSISRDIRIMEPIRSTRTINP